MKKEKSNAVRPRGHALGRLVACFFCLFLGTMTLPLQAQDQDMPRVSLDVKNETLIRVIENLREQTRYNFMFNSEELRGITGITLRLEKVSLRVALDKLLKEGNRGLTYTIEGKTVVIRKQTQTPSKPVIIRGKVQDVKKHPLPGVTVLVKGTTTGVVTDVNGEFVITVRDKDETLLVFSFIGMKTQTRKCSEYKSDKEWVVTMEEEQQEMDEVVVTGYQTLRKNELTGAVQSITGDELMKVNTFSVDAMLQGKLAGVHVINPSSTPGVNPKIRIRGQSSITGNREPLWVVDGRVLEEPVQVSAEELNSLDAVNFIARAISFINPEDIDRIDVLQDASATAIYGVRAANGVIVITTKKGKPGPTRISYSMSLAFQQRPDYEDMHLMNSKERTEVSEEMHLKGLKYTGYTPSIIGYDKALEDLWSRKITEDEFHQEVKKIKETNTDWYDILMKDRLNHNHTLGISGGNREMRYRVSLGFSQQGDAIREVNQNRYMVTASLNNQLSENFSLDVNLNLGIGDSERPHSSINPMKYAFETSRVLPAYNEDGSLYFYNYATPYSSGNVSIDKAIQYNILNEYQTTGNERFDYNYAGTLNWQWNFTPSFYIGGSYSYTLTGTEGTEWATEKSTYAQMMRMIPYGILLPDDGALYIVCRLPYGGILITDKQRNRSYNLRHTLSYSKTFGENHNLSLYLGTELSSAHQTGLKETDLAYQHDRGLSFADVDLQKWVGFAQEIRNNPAVVTDNKNNRFACFATLAYTYASKYILNFNIRTEGSNRFGENKKTRFLPVWSASARWNAGNESFIRNWNVFDNLSFRFSYGWQGNIHQDATPYVIARNEALDGDMQEYTSLITQYPNEKLRWEKTISLNYGIDFAIFDNFLNISFDAYWKKGKDQIVSQKIDPINGLSRFSMNAGNVKNTGWSLSFGMTPIRTKNFSWNLSFTTSMVKNEVTNAGIRNDEYTNYLNGTVVINGESLDSFYSYRFAGLDENGMPTFDGINQFDEEGNLIVNSYEEAIALAMEKSGDRVAPLSGGLSMGVIYKHWSLNASFSLNVGNKIRLNPLYGEMIQSIANPMKNMQDEFVNRWQKPGDENYTNIPVLSNNEGRVNELQEYETAYSLWEMYDYANVRVVSGNFLKCNALSLTYMFDTALVKKIGMQNLSLSLDVARPFVIKSKDLKGRDPEQMDLGSGAMPPLRSYAFALSVTF